MYTKYFGFEELPFSITPDPQFVYNSTVYDDVLNMLRYNVEAKKGFTVVTGEAGTGKTTLLRRLMRSFSDRVDCAYIIYPHLEFVALLRAILKDLGVPIHATDKESILEQLNDYVLEQHNQGRIVAWLFDEAQGLSDEVLEEFRLLGNIETNTEKLIQFILAGQPELESRLDKPEFRQFKQRISLRRVIHPLAAHEVHPYVDARLDQVGYKGVELFSPNAIERISRYSRGIPRLINTICDNGLLRAYREGAQTVTTELIDEVATELRLVDLSNAVAQRNFSRVDQERDLAELVSVANADGGDRERDTVTGDGREEPRRIDEAETIGERAQTVAAALIEEAASAARLDEISRAMAQTNLTSVDQERDLAKLDSVPDADGEDRQHDTVTVDEPEEPRWFDEPQTMQAAQLTNAKRLRLSIGALMMVVVLALGLAMLFPLRREGAVPQAKNLNEVVGSAVPGSAEPRTSVEIGGDRRAGKVELPPAALTPLPSLKTTRDPYQQIAEPSKETQPPEAVDTGKVIRRPGEGVFRVTNASFLRSKPTANAEIIDTLRPGSRIEVTSLAGEYFRVRGLGNENILGFVHKQDAFFEAVQ